MMDRVRLRVGCQLFFLRWLKFISLEFGENCWYYFMKIYVCVHAHTHVGSWLREPHNQRFLMMRIFLSFVVELGLLHNLWAQKRKSSSWKRQKKIYEAKPCEGLLTSSTPLSPLHFPFKCPILPQGFTLSCFLFFVFVF